MMTLSVSPETVVFNNYQDWEVTACTYTPLSLKELSLIFSKNWQQSTISQETQNIMSKSLGGGFYCNFFREKHWLFIFKHFFSSDFPQSPKNKASLDELCNQNNICHIVIFFSLCFLFCDLISYNTFKTLINKILYFLDKVELEGQCCLVGSRYCPLAKWMFSLYVI